MLFGVEPPEVFVELAFIERVDSRWASLIRNHVGVEISTVASRRTADHLCLEIRTENATAHSNAKPKLPPASVAVVTVPGPIKAAATMAPGPNFCRE